MEVDSLSAVPIKGIEVPKSVAPKIDLGHLVCEDLQPVEQTLALLTSGREWEGKVNFPFFGVFKKSKLSEEELLALNRDNVQCILNELWKLPSRRVEDAVVVQLPATSIILPREKPIPKDRSLTKWQQYAKEKGILKKKKSNLEWDDVSQSWKPRWGYRSAKNDAANNWLIEVPEHGDPNKDYFGEKADKKRERVAKNEMQRIRNITKQKGAAGASVAKLPDDVIPSGIGMSEKKMSAQDISRQIARAKQSTASLGKHQKSLKDETAPKNRGLKRKFAPNELDFAAEKAHQLKMLDNLGKKKTKIDVSKAIARETVDAESHPDENGDSGGKTAAKSGSRINRSKNKNKRQQFNEQRKKIGGPGALALSKGQKPKKTIAISKKTKHAFKTGKTTRGKK